MTPICKRLWGSLSLSNMPLAEYKACFLKKGHQMPLKRRPYQVVVPVSYKESQMVIKKPHIESISGLRFLDDKMIQKLFLDPLLNLKCPI